MEHIPLISHLGIQLNNFLNIIVFFKEIIIYLLLIFLCLSPELRRTYNCLLFLTVQSWYDKPYCSINIWCYHCVCFILHIVLLMHCINCLVERVDHNYFFLTKIFPYRKIGTLWLLEEKFFETNFSQVPCCKC